jgi:MFS family permease
MLLAAPKYNYGAICGIYFLSSIGLGGNIPIDATIALEFLPQKRRAMVSLLSMWQPVGVVVASGIAYGTAAKYRCDTTLPACNAVADGESCCTVAMNMGWRYEYIIIGAMTLLVFVARFFIFKFYESPKFLLSKGKEQEAIDVLHKIAKFNGQPAPTLTVEMFREIDSANGVDPDAEASGSHAKNVVAGVIKSVAHLKGLFFNRLELLIFALLALAYMVSRRGSQVSPSQEQSSPADTHQGDYWSFNLAGSFLPIVLLKNNVSTGQTTVTDTYREYVYIYLPGVIGAILALFSVQMPLLGRKWSLVLSAALQGLSMAMYTQVKTTAGYVGLNALEYIMQTVSRGANHVSQPVAFCG